MVNDNNINHIEAFTVKDLEEQLKKEKLKNQIRAEKQKRPKNFIERLFEKYIYK